MKKTIVVLLFMASLGLFSVLVAGEVYVSPHGSDRNAGTKEAPYLTLNRAIKQARESRRLNRPEAAGGICICLEDGVYAQSAPLFIRPEDSGTPDTHPCGGECASCHQWRSGSGRMEEGM